MSSINAQTIALRNRLVGNFDLLVNAGVDVDIAGEIVRKHKELAFSEIRFTDDKIVILYKTCRSTHRVEFPIAA